MLKLLIYSTGVRAVGTILAAIVSVVLARILGVDGYGTYAFALSIVTMAGIVGQLGLPTLVVRETAALSAQGRSAAVSLLRRWAVRLSLTVSLAIAGIGLVLAWIVHTATSAPSIPTIALALILLPLISLEQINCATLRGLNRTILGQTPEYLIRPSLLLLFVLVGYVTFPKAGAVPEVMIVANIGAVLGSSLLARLLLQADFAHYRDSGIQPDAVHVKRWTTSMLPFTVLASASVLLSQTDFVLLGLLADTSSVGIYRVATQISSLVLFGLNAVNVIIAPQLAALYQRNELKLLEDVAVGAARLAAGLAALVVLVVLVFGENLVALVFGDDYRSSYGALVILTVGQFFNAAMGSVGYILNMTGFERDSMQGFAIGAASNVLLNATLIPIYGVIGAAIGTSVSIVIWNLILAHKVKARLGITASAWTFSGRRTHR